MGRHAVNLAGQRFGRLVVVDRTSGRTRHRTVIWRVQCDCGRLTTANGDKLRKGRIKSCGCAQYVRAVAGFEPLHEKE